ncbi:MAG TPA: lytic transglycosylase domain-containing protein [Actinomycetota bacterium]|nr:lytic transglycosylase domain-containing protein [Actinomycetota bacterium]
MHRLLLVPLLVLASCSAPVTSAGSPTDTPMASPSPTRQTITKDAHEFPSPLEQAPRSAAKVARQVTRVQELLPPMIERWAEEGGGLRSELGKEVRRGALWQQKLYRSTSHKERRAKRVLARLSPRHARILRRHVVVQQRLSSLVTPVKLPIEWKTYRPASPHKLLRFYRAGERRFDVPWEVLASVNSIESRFGRILGPSSAGALGPMQFMPATWDAYGGGGDIMDPHDSIIAAARYLAASGAPENMRGALFAYNRSDEYVDAILGYANQMKRDARYYYAYYFWEVYVRTVKGDKQLTGPGGIRGPRN